VSYAGEIRYARSLPAEPNVADSDALGMFEFVQAQTSPDDVLVFPKPRTLALFTGRRVAALSPDQSMAQSLAFLRAIHATVLIDAEWSAIKPDDEIKILDARKVFQNGEYRVYRVNSPAEIAESGDGNPPSRK
jgi:hypothetical protein